MARSRLWGIFSLIRGQVERKVAIELLVKNIREEHGRNANAYAGAMDARGV
jgi:hypothetical protein